MPAKLAFVVSCVHTDGSGARARPRFVVGTNAIQMFHCKTTIQGQLGLCWKTFYVDQTEPLVLTTKRRP